MKKFTKIFCYKLLGGFSKNYGELFSIDLYGPKQKIAVPRLCNEIMLTASVFAPQPELPSSYVEVLKRLPQYLTTYSYGISSGENKLTFSRWRRCKLVIVLKTKCTKSSRTEQKLH